MNSHLTVVQYNCVHSNAQSSRALFDSFTHPQILAIQEPCFNRYTKSTYCPKPYELAYEAGPETRVCFMIRRDAGVTHWKRRQYGPNVAALILETGIGHVTIINVYNPRARGPQVQEWQRIELAYKRCKGRLSSSATSTPITHSGEGWESHATKMRNTYLIRPEDWISRF